MTARHRVAEVASTRSAVAQSNAGRGVHRYPPYRRLTSEERDGHRNKAKLLPPTRPSPAAPRRRRAPSPEMSLYPSRPDRLPIAAHRPIPPPPLDQLERPGQVLQRERDDVHQAREGEHHQEHEEQGGVELKDERQRRYQLGAGLQGEKGRGGRGEQPGAPNRA